MLIPKYKLFLKIKQALLLSPHKVLQTKSVSGHCGDNGWQLTNRIQTGPGVQWDSRIKCSFYNIYKYFYPDKTRLICEVICLLR